jgi:hypothetical protein
MEADHSKQIVKKLPRVSIATQLKIFYALNGHDLSPLIKELNPKRDRELIRSIFCNSPRANERSTALELLDPQKDHDLLVKTVNNRSWSPRYYKALRMMNRKCDRDLLVKIASHPYGGKDSRLIALEKLNPDPEEDGNQIAKIAVGTPWLNSSDKDEAIVRIAAIKMLNPNTYRLILEQIVQNPENNNPDRFLAVGQSAREKLGLSK